MRIDVNNLKNELDYFCGLLSELEENCLYFYNDISSFSFYWNDDRATHFMDDIKKEKSIFLAVSDDLSNIKKVYQYMVSSYGKIAKYIDVDLEKKTKIYTKYNNRIAYLNNIIRKFNNLDLSFCPELSYSILHQRDKLVNTRDKLIDSRNAINKYFNEIEKINNEVKQKSGKLSATIFNVTDISAFL